MSTLPNVPLEYLDRIDCIKLLVINWSNNYSHNKPYTYKESAAKTVEVRNYDGRD